MDSKRMKTVVASGIAALTLTASTALAQGTATQGTGNNAGSAVSRQAPAPIAGEQTRIDLGQWEYEELYRSGWRAEQLIGANVIGQSGEEIGDVENIMIGPEGKVLSIIAEIGGFLDIGDTHVNIPWNEVQFTSGKESVKVPLTEENLDQYSLFGDEEQLGRGAASRIQRMDDPATGPRVWRATELTGDYVRLQGGEAYGYVDDLIFNRDGTLRAVSVTRDVGYGNAGPYAYPYYGYGYGAFDPGLDYYGLPYAEDEVADVEPFEYEEMDGSVFQ
ncbi:PRC-barrel domain-containing protein [Skermanella rosea]|uniref:PRC-barrel domain-containing protein n=1 Tax=Skermanella rosea TaxID=1817965 RepID=UPI0019313B55|nr:PRC-barrel domain-containing protein [Skermanella rosea]UEM01816.1 PRC-barrel domain-containing protein [Skermanella rosea]